MDEDFRIHMLLENCPLLLNVLDDFLLWSEKGRGNYGLCDGGYMIAGKFWVWMFLIDLV